MGCMCSGVVLKCILKFPISPSLPYALENMDPDHWNYYKP